MHPELYPEGEVPDPLLPFYNPYTKNGENIATPFDISRIGSVGKSYLAIGDGGCFSAGLFNGEKGKNYVIEIDKEGELGTATFKWSDRWDGSLGNAPYKNYSNEPIITSWNGERIKTTPQGAHLNNGVIVRFTGGEQIVGRKRTNYKNQVKYNFHVGDRYYFKTYSKSNEVVFGDLHVPPNSQPGKYNGTVIVTASNHPKIEIPISLTVYNIQIPQSKSMDSAYGRAIDPMVYHSASPSKSEKILKNYEEILHQHRIDYQIFNAKPKFTFNQQEELVSVNWDAFDAYASPRLNGEYWNDKNGMRRFSFDFSWLYPGAPGKSKKKTQIIAKETFLHLKKKGWFDKAYVYCLDEAGERLFPQIKQQIDWIKEAVPQWDGKFMLTSTPTHGNILLDSINIWCPLTIKFDNWSEYGQRAGNYFTRKDYQTMIKDKGDTFWFYVANYPTSGAYMSYQLDRLSCFEPRLLKWASWYEGATGFLFWSTIGSNASVPNPYLNPWFTERYSRNGKASGVNGDAFLIYPGDRNGKHNWKKATGHGIPFKPIDGPLPSIRLKQIRDGFEDWEMFLLAEKAGLANKIRMEVKKVYQKLGSSNAEYVSGKSYWSRDDQLMWQVRDNIARMLENKK